MPGNNNTNVKFSNFIMDRVDPTNVPTPPTGRHRYFYDLSGNFSSKDEAGTVTIIGASTGSNQAPIYHAPVAAVATANVNIASPGATLDSYALSVGDRILLTGQSTGAENGLWTWNGAAVALTRPTDYSAASTFWATAGLTVLVLNGTLHKFSTWRLTTTGAITIDTTTTAWIVNAIDATVIGANVPAAGTFTTLTATTYLQAASWATAGRPGSPAAGMLGYNTDTTRMEFYAAAGWRNMVRLDGDTMTGALVIAPSADSTAVLNVKNNAATNYILDVDTTNQRVGINGLSTDSPEKKLHVFYGDMKFTQITAPTACTAALAGAGAGNIDNGNHIYKVTFVNNAGETELGTASNTINVVDKTTNGQISLTGIPTAAAGLQVSSRKIYRTKAGGSTYFFVATISDNTTTTYTDNATDASLGSVDSTSRQNSTGANVWVGIFRNGVLGGTNVGWGPSALRDITSGFQNIGLGSIAGAAITSGSNNVCLGNGAGSSGTTMTGNLCIGTSAGLSLTTASNNVIFGILAGQNPALGGSGNATTTGSSNTFMGAQTGQASATQRSKMICIGFNAIGDASNLAVIGGTGTDEVVITSGRTTASAKLDLARTDAVTNAVTDLLWLSHKSSGTPAASFGTGFKILADTNGGTDQAMVYLQTIWVDATNASRKARGILQVFDTAAREALRVEASGTAPMIGFLGAAAAAQQTGGAATAGATYGATEQTMLQKVYDMGRTFGFLS